METQIHAEKLVKAQLEHFGVRVEPIPFYFFRIRSSGVFTYHEEFLPEAQFPVPTCNDTMITEFEQRWGKPFWASWKRREARAKMAADFKAERDAREAAEMAEMKANGTWVEPEEEEEPPSSSFIPPGNLIETPEEVSMWPPPGSWPPPAPPPAKKRRRRAGRQERAGA